MAEEIIYSDIKYDLKRTQYSDFKIQINFDAIKQSIETILLTKKGDRTKFQNPYFGSNIHHLLFEKMSLFTTIQIKYEIKTVLEIWEPRIKIIDINVESDYDLQTYNVDIQYRIIDLNIEDELILKLDIIK